MVVRGRGRPLKPLTDEEKNKILDGIRHGLGMSMIEPKLGITNERRDRGLADDPEFKRKYDEAFKYLRENKVFIAHKLALEGNEDMLWKLINRDDISRRWSQEMKLARELKARLAALERETEHDA